MAIRIYTQRVGVGDAPGYRQNLRARPEGALRLAEGAQRAAEGFEQVRQQVLEEQDTAAVQEAWAKLSTAKQSLLDDPENGFATAKKGKDAIAERDSVLNYFDKYAQSIGEGLSNDRQRQAFGRMAGKEQLAFRDSVDRHTVQQGEVVRKQSQEAALTAALGEVVGAAKRGEYDKVQDAIAQGAAAVGVAGDDPEYTAGRRKAFETDAHLGVLRTMLEQGKAKDAKEYLASSRRYMDEKTILESKIEPLINAGNKRSDARGLEEQAWAASKLDAKGKEVAPEGDPAKAEEWLRAQGIKDTETLDEAMQRVQQRGSAQIAARRQADAPKLERLKAKMLDPRGGGFSTLDDDFVNLYDKAAALELWQRDKDRRGDQGSQKRREQMERDRLLLETYGGLDLVGEDGQDKVTIDVDRMTKEFKGSPWVAERLRSKQKAAQTNVAKDDGVSAQEFSRQLDAKLATVPGMTAKQLAAVRKYANGRHANWQSPKGPGIPPTQADVDQWIGDWFIYGERGRSAGWSQPDMYAIEAEMEGEPFQPPGGGPERPAPAKEPAAAPTASAVILVGPGGKRRTAAPSAELDAWLAKHPEWKRQ